MNTCFSHYNAPSSVISSSEFATACINTTSVRQAYRMNRNGLHHCRFARSTVTRSRTHSAIRPTSDRYENNCHWINTRFTKCQRTVYNIFRVTIRETDVV